MNDRETGNTMKENVQANAVWGKVNGCKHEGYNVNSSVEGGGCLCPRTSTLSGGACGIYARLIPQDPAVSLHHESREDGITCQSRECALQCT